MSSETRGFNLLLVARLYLLLAVLSVVVIAMAAMTSNQPFPHAECQSLSLEERETLAACLGGVQVIDLALVGSRETLVCLLKPVPRHAAPSECIEERIDRFRYRLQTLDSSLFIPCYIGLSVALALWVPLLPYPHAPRRLLWVVGGLLVATALLVGLDYAENAKALKMLEEAQRPSLWRTSPPLLGLEPVISAAREASLWKWFAAALWAMAIAAAAIQASRAQQTKYQLLWRSSLHVAASLGIIGALLLIIGVAGPMRLRTQDATISAGFLLACMQLVFVAVGVLGMRPPWFVRHALIKQDGRHLNAPRAARQGNVDGVAPPREP